MMSSYIEYCPGEQQLLLAVAAKAEPIAALPSGERMTLLESAVEVAA